MQKKYLPIKKEGYKTASLISKICLAIFVLTFTNSIAQTNSNECTNGLSPALGFNAFVQYGVSLASGDTEGPIAMGGDLTLDGTFTVAAHTGGTYYDNNDSQPSSLIVNGKIIYKSNQGINLNNGFAKIGDLTGSTVYDKDNNNVTTNTKITPGEFNQSPRILLQRNQDFSSVNADVIDFDAAFIELNATSIEYSELANNITIENGNKITLADDTTNVLNVTGEELNNLTNFTFNNKPTQDSPLIINVDYSGDFVWRVQNQAGIGDQQGAFILYNFYNATQITIDSGTTIMGTLFAPSSHVIKKSSDNINGQVIAQSYVHLNGELHQHTYNTCEEDTTIDTPGGEGEGEGEDDNPPIDFPIPSEDDELPPIDFPTPSEEDEVPVIDFPTPSEEDVLPVIDFPIQSEEDLSIPLVDLIFEEEVDACLSSKYAVDVYPTRVTSTDILNIDIAIDKDQIINYTTYQLSGTSINSTDVKLPKGCNNVKLNLSEHTNLVANSIYLLVVKGDGWIKTITFITLP